MAKKHNLLQIINRIWLMDLIKVIQPISKTYFVIYNKQANNTKKAYLLKYCKVVIELREVFQNLSKAIPIMAKGNTFNIDFAGKFKKNISTTKVQKERENSLSCS